MALILMAKVDFLEECFSNQSSGEVNRNPAPDEPPFVSTRIFYLAPD